jgi:selenocysteine lyase/cysteine desulfurase
MQVLNKVLVHGRGDLLEEMPPYLGGGEMIEVGCPSHYRLCRSAAHA